MKQSPRIFDEKTLNELMGNKMNKLIKNQMTVFNEDEEDNYSDEDSGTIRARKSFGKKRRESNVSPKAKPSVFNKDFLKKISQRKDGQSTATQNV